MRVVSNTSPISNLAFIGRLDLLWTQFGEVWIPPAVAEELGAHPSPDGLQAIQIAIQAGKIRLAEPAGQPFINLLLMDLHRGEAEAIALASELGARLILIDEQEGRRMARLAGLSVTGLLGVLLHAKQAGQLLAIKPEIAALRTKARFFISPRLEERILREAGE